MKIIIDTDIGSEATDAGALTLAALSSEVEILGVTTITGDTVFRASVAKRFLNLLGKSNIPVSAGFGKDGSNHSWEKEVVFPEGYKPLKLDPRPAHQLIVDLVNENKGNVTLVGIGPLTNIAKALELDPGLPKKFSHLALMGGMVEPPTAFGKQIPRGFEYNFCQDSASAEKVLKAGFNLTLLPGDLTFQEQDPWTEDDFSKIKIINHSVTNLLLSLKDRSLVAMEEGLKKAGVPLEFVKPWVNDEFLIAYLLKPELFTLKDQVFEWQLPDKYPRFISSGSGIKMKVLVGCDFQKVRNFIIDRFETI